jgi:hypothetical protein
LTPRLHLDTLFYDESDTLIHELRAIVGERYLPFEKEDVIVYEQTFYLSGMPEIILVPETSSATV